MGNIGELGSFLLRMMEAADMTQAELGRRSGVNACSICGYIQGLSVPRMTTLRKLDAALPGLLSAWGDDVMEYHRKITQKSVRAMQAAPRANHYKPGGALDKPSEKKRTSPRAKGPGGSRDGLGSLDQVCRAARDAGMTYGEYVARQQRG